MNDLLTFSEKYCKKYKSRLFFGLILIFISNILTVIPIPYIGKSINSIKNLFLDLSNNKNIALFKKEIFFNAVIILIVPIIGGFVKYYMRQFIITTSRMIEFDIKNDIFLHYQKLDLYFYNKNSTGDLMNRLTEDISFIRQYIGPGMMYFINLSILFFIVFIQMFRINKSLTFYVLSPIPILFILIYWISINISKNGKCVQKMQSYISSFVQETFSGIQIVKSFSAELLFSNKHKKIVLDYKNKNVILAKFETVLSSIIIFFIGLSHVFVLFFGSKKYFEGDIKEIGVIVEFFTYINILIFPIIILGWVITIIERAKISNNRINEFLREKSKMYNIGNGILTKIKFVKKIQFNNVSFNYGNSTNIINNISFILNGGNTLVLTGKTGSGKTTVAKLLSRLYDPNDGEILMNDTPIVNYNLYDYRSNIGYVPQESFIFSDSIYNNVTLGAYKRIHYNSIYRIMKNVMMEEDIFDFNNGYDTIIGGKGINLSGGQKQKICIARAIIRNPKIIIFDDSFSAMDNKTKITIMNFIQKEFYKSIIIIITNDMNYISDYNLLIELDNGKIFKNLKK
ncbi:ABC transporter ATP-binding protein [Blattabacterium cuenoti]|uniref:ABC transporter ATP-binding protein n=1 Tax=Blattabacterium cuenoti TaxID=1653831 RepID=UPI00163CD38F|nr:ABC transporter ATP-binding protein [Blattabacterium cuenoti]